MNSKRVLGPTWAPLEQHRHWQSPHRPLAKGSFIWKSWHPVKTPLIPLILLNHKWDVYFILTTVLLGWVSWTLVINHLLWMDNDSQHLSHRFPAAFDYECKSITDHIRPGGALATQGVTPPRRESFILSTQRSWAAAWILWMKASQGSVSDSHTFLIPALC